eukprot:GFYU01029396.1.p1 GENE.GFYU01029396.1~~GFYU01029396.1.p1  ORF type:complete len:343 (-),score=63.80 GFYU01029396.1:50-1078(-)
MQHYSKGVMLSVAYACSIGGVTTLTGTGPNLVLAGQYETLFPQAPPLSFGEWFGFAFPLTFTFLAIMWVCMSRIYCPPRSQCASLGEISVLQQQYNSLGRMSFAEKIVAGVFVSLVFLWFFRQPAGFPGWGALFEKGYVTDATTCVMMATVLFFLPSERGVRGWDKPVLGWEDMRDLPWGVVILLGGGFALADNVKVSKLSTAMGDGLHDLHLEELPPSITAAILCLVTAVVTEVTSNVSTSTVFIPIMAVMAQTAKVHPLFYMIPSTVACSFAFMLPAATPPNAIAISTGYLAAPDLVRVGLLLNITGVCLTTLVINLIGRPLWGLAEFPSWAELHGDSGT